VADLLSINVNEKTEKKGQLTYLSWAWAWAEVLKHDPQATWVVHTYGPQGSEQPCMWIGETAMVHTSVTINGLRRECMLPVMDNKNNAVKLPDARKISDAIMRCMTKAVSMHGLGLYIYAGEDLPEGDLGAAPKKEPVKSGSGPAIIMDGLSDDWKAWLADFARDVSNTFASAGPGAAASLIEDVKEKEQLGPEQIAGMWSLLDSKCRSALKALPRAANQVTQ
jgi:hypothetical protein